MAKGNAMFKFGIMAVVLFGACANANTHLTVFAPASLSNALKDVNALYEKQYNIKIKTSFLSSGVLAKQIEQGAKADVFISADVDWVVHLQNKGKLNKANYKNLLSNRLVLIAPKSSSLTTVKIDKSTNIHKILTGKLCTGNVKSVPVGKYAKQSLIALNWWQSVAPKLVETDNVRSALNFVNRGECQLGIVYATDVAVVKNVKTLGVFPTSTHSPIVYPVAMINTQEKTKHYYQFLHSQTAKKIYQNYGFGVF